MIRRVKRRLARAGVDAELRREIDDPLPWMYPWPVGAETLPVLHPELPSVHETRAAMIEPSVRAALEAAGPGATALDIACNEGWFSQQLLEWGAERVVGVDVRPRNVRRAELIRDHFEIPAERLSFVESDVYDLDPGELGTFDVVLLLGLVYHLENPVGAVRVAKSLTRGTCVVESQLTRQNEPIEHGWGVTDVMVSEEGSFAVFPETDSEVNPLSSTPGILSLVPNRVALRQMCEASGFAEVEFLTAAEGLNPQYVGGDRGIVVCR